MKFSSIQNILKTAAIIQASFVSFVDATTDKDDTLRVDPGVGRIVNGVPVEADTYPWFTSLLNGNFNFCAGSLIAPDIVLTAAHCMSGNFSVRIGPLKSPYQQNNNGGQYVETREVERYVRHPEFGQVTGISEDFAVIQLKEPSTITPVTFDTTGISENYQGGDNYTGEKVWAIGLGRLSAGGPTPDELMHVEVSYITNEACVNDPFQYGEGSITDDMMCAADPGEDACQGDSGGPLYDANSNILVGITSWGYGCAQAQHPGVYSRVSSGYNWIRETACQWTQTIPKPSWCDVGPTESPTSTPTQSPTSSSAPTTLSPTFEPCPSGTVEFLFEIFTDDYPLETSWNVTSITTGEEVVAGGGYSVDFTNYSDRYCIEPDSYVFVITDLWGDGICCLQGDGSYTITYDGDVIVENGGQFLVSESIEFGGTPPPACQDPTLKFQIKKENGEKSYKTCEWVAEKADKRCAYKGVSKTCPVACNSCDSCKDSSNKFKYEDEKLKCKKDVKPDPSVCNETLGSICRKSCGTCS